MTADFQQTARRDHRRFPCPDSIELINNDPILRSLQTQRRVAEQHELQFVYTVVGARSYHIAFGTPYGIANSNFLATDSRCKELLHERLVYH